MAFRSQCTSCGDCLEKCPTDIIEFGRGQMPVINFDKGECLFCGDCLEACVPKALLKVKDQPPWMLKASIDPSKCLAFKDVECRACEDPCETRAIKFITAPGSVSKPVFNFSDCNGCGACFSVCPTRAINLKQQIHPEESYEY
jgi:ferredoxin-type protein NapF